MSGKRKLLVEPRLTALFCANGISVWVPYFISTFTSSSLALGMNIFLLVICGPRSSCDSHVCLKKYPRVCGIFIGKKMIPDKTKALEYLYMTMVALSKFGDAMYSWMTGFQKPHLFQSRGRENRYQSPPLWSISHTKSSTATANLSKGHHTQLMIMYFF